MMAMDRRTKKISRVVVDGPRANSVFISSLLDTAVVLLVETATRSSILD